MATKFWSGGGVTVYYMIKLTTAIQPWQNGFWPYTTASGNIQVVFAKLIGQTGLANTFVIQSEQTTNVVFTQLQSAGLGIIFFIPLGPGNINFVNLSTGPFANKAAINGLEDFNSTHGWHPIAVTFA